MPAPTDLNSRIALAKGWTWHEESFFLAPDFGSVPELRTHWLAPIRDGERYAEPGTPSDFVGTLEGVSGMLWELNHWNLITLTKAEAWYIAKSIQNQIAENGSWVCRDANVLSASRIFVSSKDRPGDCVGKAYMSVFGREIDVSTTD